MKAEIVSLGLAVSFAVFIFRVRSKRQANVANSPSNGLSRLIFLGSGCSGGTPISLCLLGLIPGRPSQGCAVCRSAYENPTHRNHRRNPCVLLQNPSRSMNTLIDCGKTFREAALTWFPRFNVRGIDHIILTRKGICAQFNPKLT